MSEKYPPTLLPEDIAKVLGPYANWDPEKDPYLQSHPPPKVTQNPLDYFKGYVAGWPGALGDLHESLRPINLLQAPIPTSEELGQALGADTESDAFKAGTIGLPWLDDALLKLGPLAGSVIGFTEFAAKRADKGIRKLTTKIDDLNVQIDALKQQRREAHEAFNDKWGEALHYRDRAKINDNWLNFMAFSRKEKSLPTEWRQGVDYIGGLDSQVDDLVKQKKQLEFERRGLFDQLSQQVPKDGQ